jgi:hypothetical protein
MPAERQRIRLGSWTFADDALVWPLKAADVLAYGCYNQERFGKERELFDILTSRIQIFRIHIDAAYAKEIVAELEALYAERKRKRGGAIIKA